MSNGLNSYVADGLAFRVDIVFDAGSTVTDLTGATVSAFAKMVSGGETFTGTASVVGAHEIDVIFAPGILPVGVGIVHVRAIPPGHSGQTVSSETFTMEKSLGV